MLRSANFLLSAVLLMSNAYAVIVPGNKNPEKEFQCYHQMDQYIEQWGAKKNWSVKLSSGPSFVYNSPTNRLAQWVTIAKQTDGEMLSKLSPSDRIEVLFDRKCQKKVRVVPVANFKSSTEFSDAKLGKLFQKNNSGMIIFWSPGMYHSLSMISNAQKVSKKHGIPLLILLDPYADKKLAAKALKKRGIASIPLLKNHSFELVMRQSLIHYPNVIFYKDGAVSSPVLPGLVGEELLFDFAQRYTGAKK